jgi:hypothetical protein
MESDWCDDDRAVATMQQARDIEGPAAHGFHFAVGPGANRLLVVGKCHCSFFLFIMPMCEIISPPRAGCRVHPLVDVIDVTWS